MKSHNTRQLKRSRPKQTLNDKKNSKLKTTITEYGSNLSWKSSKQTKELIEDGELIRVVTDLTETGCRKDINQCWCVKVDANGNAIQQHVCFFAFVFVLYFVWTQKRRTDYFSCFLLGFVIL